MKIRSILSLIALTFIIFSCKKEVMKVDKDYLKANEELKHGEYLLSKNEKYKLVFQLDSNLVVYKDGTIVEWTPKPDIFKKGATKCFMQSDGNFVVYNARDSALFNTGTYNYPKAILFLHDDGIFAIYSGSKQVWKSK